LDLEITVGALSWSHAWRYVSIKSTGKVIESQRWYGGDHCTHSISEVQRWYWDRCIGICEIIAI